MPNIAVSQTVSGVGVTIKRVSQRSGDGIGARELTVPVGKSGTLATRTDNETGSLTLGSGHGITTGQVVDLYWAGGARYKITVGTVSGTTVPIGADNSGYGSNLPTAATAIICSPRVGFEAAIDGDAVSHLSMQQVYESKLETAESHVEFRDSGAAKIYDRVLQPNVLHSVDIEGGQVNVVTGNPIVSGAVSNRSTTNVATFKLLWNLDASN